MSGNHNQYQRDQKIVSYKTNRGQTQGEKHMTKDKALKLADWLDGDKPMHCEEAAAKLRRLHEENEKLNLIKYSFKTRFATRGYELQINDLKDRITTLEAALRQAVEALNTARPACFAENTLTAIDEALIAAEQVLGEE